MFWWDNSWNVIICAAKQNIRWENFEKKNIKKVEITFVRSLTDKEDRISFYLWNLIFIVINYTIKIFFFNSRKLKQRCCNSAAGIYKLFGEYPLPFFFVVSFFPKLENFSFFSFHVNEELLFHFYIFEKNSLRNIVIKCTEIIFRY